MQLRWISQPREAGGGPQFSRIWSYVGGAVMVWRGKYMKNASPADSSNKEATTTASKGIGGVPIFISMSYIHLHCVSHFPSILFSIFLIILGSQVSTSLTSNIPRHYLFLGHQVGTISANLEVPFCKRTSHQLRVLVHRELETQTHTPVVDGRIPFIAPSMYPRVEYIALTQSMDLEVGAKQEKRGTKTRSSCWNPCLTFLLV